jgi:hypothetical protein
MPVSSISRKQLDSAVATMKKAIGDKKLASVSAKPILGPGPIMGFIIDKNKIGLGDVDALAKQVAGKLGQGSKAATLIHDGRITIGFIAPGFVSFG